MKLIAATSSFLAMAISCSANADCVDVIKASMQRTTKIEQETEIKQNAEAFCHEYYNRQEAQKSASFNASYSFLSGAIASGSATESEVASKYCSKTNNSYVRDDVYRNYIEFIAPEAFNAYEICVKHADKGLEYTINPMNVLPKELPISISYDPREQSAYVVLDFVASDGVSCAWTKGNGWNNIELIAPNNVNVISSNGDKKFFSSHSKVIKLKKGTQTHLHCTRGDASKRSFVELKTNNATYESLSFPWKAYAGDIPVDTLAAINARVQAFTNSMNGAVVGFNSDKCPDGWEEYRPAYGRFVRGIDKNQGTDQVDPDGTRKAGSLQEDALQQHNHSAQYHSAHTVGGRPHPNMEFMTIHGNSTLVTTHITEGRSNPHETRPKNIALLYCIKK